MVIPLLDISHQFRDRDGAKIPGEQIEMQGQHAGGLCSSLEGAIRKDKVFDKCFPGLLSQVVISFRIFILAQYMCDLCKQVAAVSKKCSTNQFLGCPTFAPITSIQSEPVAKTMPARIFGVTAQSILAGLG